MLQGIYILILPERKQCVTMVCNNETRLLQGQRPQWQWHRGHCCSADWLPLRPSSGNTELDETEDLHFGLSVTAILKCGCSLWDVAANLSGEGQTPKQQCLASSVPVQGCFSDLVKIVGRTDSRKGLKSKVINCIIMDQIKEVVLC